MRVAFEIENKNIDLHFNVFTIPLNMEFYFCEGCGKRITDKDLALGLARNKQIKGVYCINCSAGVSTVEFDAIFSKPVDKAPSESIHDRPAALKEGHGHRLPNLKLKKGKPPKRSRARRGVPLFAAALLMFIIILSLFLKSQKPALVASSEENPPSAPPAMKNSGVAPAGGKSTVQPLRISSQIHNEPPRAPEIPTARPVRIDPDKSSSSGNPKTVIPQAAPEPQKMQSAVPRLIPEKPADPTVSIPQPDAILVDRKNTKILEPLNPKPITGGETTVVLQAGAPVAAFGIKKYAGLRMNSIYPATHPKSTAEPLTEICKAGEVGWHPLIYFSIFDWEGGVLSENTEILEAKLYLYKPDSHPASLSIRRLKTEWKETEANWQLAQKGKPWSSAGGDVEAKPSAMAQGTEKPGWCSFDVSNDLREFQNTNSNFGWRVDADTRSFIIRFASGIYADPSLRPKLILRYRPKDTKPKVSPKSP